MNSFSDNSIVIQGSVTRVVYRNSDTGFAVIELETLEGDEITAVGILSMIQESEVVEITGKLTEHPTYGLQIKAETCSIQVPSDIAGIEKYLASGLVKGIGPSTARRIVSHFGKETLNIMLYNPSRLEEVSGIGVVKAAMIAESFRDQYQMRDVIIFLQSNGITPAYAIRIYKAYGENTKAFLTENPYRMVTEIDGIGFLTADKIGRNLGMSLDDERRLQAGLSYVLEEATEFGHTCLPKDELIKKASDLLNADIGNIERALQERLIQGTLIIDNVLDNEFIYLPKLLHAERYTAMKIARLSLGDTVEYYGMDTLISAAEEKYGITLADSQKEAVKAALTQPLTVITGGPGTGKTTILKAILEILSYTSEVTLLAAPTGRAAKRMQETTGFEAKTIHRLLEYTGGSDGPGYFNRNDDNRLDCTVLAVDECSMVDIFLIDRLLRALPDNARLILIGDHDQLPSVGPGNVLKDIISSGAGHIVELNEIYRQARESLIVTNAHKVNHGKMPELYNRKNDFFFEEHQGQSQTASAIVGLLKDRLPSYSGHNAFNGMQVLSPMKKGEAGVSNLNLLLQEALNPPDSDKPELRSGKTVFRLGDKVMQTKNNYMLNWSTPDEYGEGVFNGDIGLITDINMGEKTMEITFDDGKCAVYDAETMQDLDLAYAISVHKSQGSEYPVVVLAVTVGNPMLMTRNLLYTALTRAKELVVIVGSERLISNMVENNRIIKRYGALEERIREILENPEIPGIS